MSEFIKSQQEVRANLIAQVRGVIDTAEAESRGLVAEDMQKIDRMEADIRSADMAIEVATRNEERKSEAAVAAAGFVPAVESRSDADLFRSMARGEIREHNFEARATLVNSVNTVPVSFYDQVFAAARLVGPWLDNAEVITRTSGNDLRLPIYTAFSTAATSAQGSAIAESNPTFDSILIQPTKTGFIVPVANELLSDAGFDIASVISEQAGNAIGYAINASVTTVVNGAAGSGVTAGTAVLTADNLIDLVYSVDGAARRVPGAGFQANGSTIGAIRKLKDTVGSYIYNPVVGGPDTILGLPINENPNMPSIGTGAKSVIFGDLRAAKVVTTGLDVATSVDAYFANDVTAYRFTYRFGSALTHAAKIKYLVHA